MADAIDDLENMAGRLNKAASTKRRSAEAHVQRRELALKGVRVVPVSYDSHVSTHDKAAAEFAIEAVRADWMARARVEQAAQLHALADEIEAIRGAICAAAAAAVIEAGVVAREIRAKAEETLRDG